MWANPSTPNLPDYTLFVSGVMGINTLYLPADSPFLDYALHRALGIVLIVPTISGYDYTLAVYNCAGHIQVEITPDQIVNGTSRQFFADKRKEYGLLMPSFGVVQTSSDQSSSTTLAVPDGLAQLTIQDLGFMKTPWGREYLAYAQDYGPTVWGLS
jgi:hypothetical protein